MDARLEIKKFEENGQTRFSLRMQGYIEDMLDMTAMSMISIANKYNVSLDEICSDVKVRAAILRRRQELIHGSFVTLSESVVKMMEGRHEPSKGNQRLLDQAGQEA